jgi:hypothetical protein
VTTGISADGAQRRLVFSDLHDYPIMAQALDNQWMPPQVAAARQTAAPWEPQDGAAADAEFRRALVNSGTLVVNRAFLLNTPAVYRNYLATSEEHTRAALAALLHRGELVPYLYNESGAEVEPSFDCSEEVFAAWRSLVEQTRPSCVRLSWNDQENAELAARVNQYFAATVQHINRLDPDQLGRDLGIGRDRAEDLRRGTLRDIAAWAVGMDDTAAITRNRLYAQFFTRPGTRPHERLLREGEHVVPAKQLVDLVYNTSLPTLGGISAYTPPQSPPRSTLQELRAPGGEFHDPEHIGRLLGTFQGVVADTLQRGLDGPNSYATLSLPDIVRLRSEEEWRGYIDSLQALVVEGFAGGRLPDAEEFAARARSAARAHASMLRAARRIMRGGRSSRRDIRMELTMTMPGAGISVFAEDTLILGGAVATAAVSPLVIRLLFRDRIASPRHGLTHSITFPVLRLRNARKDLEEILRVFRAEYGKVSTGDSHGHRAADRQAAET